MVSCQNIVLVNYLNSKPFEYGLKMSGLVSELNIVTAHPSKCAALYEAKKTDIALVPVGALHDLDDYDIITDYCIGCDGEVRTVCIFSNMELSNCNRLFLDNHSRTSFLLSKLILKEYLQLDIKYEPLDIINYTPKEKDAVLMIGDKVFEYESTHNFKYDLGNLWKQWTGLPFVFAVWIARKGVSDEFKLKLNDSFKTGISNLPEIIQQESSQNLDLQYYFSNNIQYNFDDLKQKAFELFMEKSGKFSLTPLP